MNQAINHRPLYVIYWGTSQIKLVLFIFGQVIAKTWQACPYVFGHNLAIFGPIGLKCFIGTQENIYLSIDWQWEIQV